MKKLFVMTLTAVAGLVAGAAYTGCIMGYFDEPEMSKRMIER